MSNRHFPVDPNLDQRRRQVEGLLVAYRRGDRESSADFERLHPQSGKLSGVKLTD